MSTIGEAASPTEPAFAQQAEAVRTGASDTIRLDKTLVTDQDLVQLDGLDGKLRRINLSQTELSDAALARLAKCTELEQLRIASPRFTNEGVALLAEMPKLKYLHLIDSPLTDEALPHLKKLTGLSSLYLDGTEISLNGMRELSEALPDTHKHFDGGHFRDDPRADVHEK
jgi:Leucine-rich repeat (LRR) protein